MITLTPNMSLPVPVVGNEVGPQWATDINGCMTILDGHTHAAGSGTQITPSGLNINSDLTVVNNNIITIRSSRYNPQSAPLALAADVGAVYVSGVDLYYNDVNGIQIRLTQAGSIVGTSGSITGLVSPASASYNSLNGTFVFQQNVNTAANIDVASVIVRKTTASSNGITIQAPTGLASDYSLILPALPGVLSVMSLDASGNMGTLGVSSTIGINAGTIIVNPASLSDTQMVAKGITAASIADNTITELQMAPLSVGTPELIDFSVTDAKRAPLNYAVAASSGAFSTGSGTPQLITNQSVNLTTSGLRPVYIQLQADASTVNDSNIGSGEIIIKRNTTIIARYSYGATLPPSSIAFVDIVPGNAINSYQAFGASTGPAFNCNNIQLIAYEL